MYVFAAATVLAKPFNKPESDFPKTFQAQIESAEAPGPPSPWDLLVSRGACT